MIPWRIKKPFAYIAEEFTQWFRAILSGIPGQIGCFLRAKLYGFHSGAKSRVFDHVIIHHPQKLRLGTNVQIASACHLNAGGGIEIADNALIGPKVSIWSQNHVFARTDLPICDQGYEFAPVKIEEDVWIGCGAIILPGVVLAKGCVIGAGAVVTSSTQPNTVYVGVPAKPINTRSSTAPPEEYTERAA